MRTYCEKCGKMRIHDEGECLVCRERNVRKITNLQLQAEVEFAKQAEQAQVRPN